MHFRPYIDNTRLLVWILLLSITPAMAVETVEFTRDGVDRTVQGEAVVRGADGGMLLRAPDNTLWILPADEIKSKQQNDQPFALAKAPELAQQLQQEMGEGFDLHVTAHYVIVYNTHEAYAKWCGGLYERLMRAFLTFWRSKGVKLEEPSSPLIALVFDSKTSYLAHARRDLGVEPGSMPGYYNVRTNRVNTYDLTGVGANNATQIRQLLMQPRAERTVATIVHEATHQLAYNTGLQTRYADNPFWVSEGLAVFFETPDLTSRRGWRGIGEINRFNYTLFRKYLPQRPANSLELLLTDDSRFRGEDQADAYSEAWALNYYLIRTKPREYGKYLKQLAERTPLVELEPAQRMQEFSAAFGPLNNLNADFIRYMQRIR